MDWTHRLRLRQLQVLISLSETQNISHSAELLHMTQPALSKWLKDLETDIGLQLFERHARGLRPTDNGRILKNFAERISNELERARDEMASLKSGSSGRAVIGGSGATIAGIVPQSVLALLREMPAASLEVIEAPMDRLFRQLVQKEIDIAVGRPSPKYHDPSVSSEVLYEDSLHFAVRHTHPLARRKVLRWNDLESQPWVVWTRDIPARELLETSLAHHGWMIPRDSIQSNSVLATIALVAESDLVAVMSGRAIELPERWKMLRRLPLRLESKSAMMMYWRKDMSDSPAVSALLSCLRLVSRRRGALK